MTEAKTDTCHVTICNEHGKPALGATCESRRDAMRWARFQLLTGPVGYTAYINGKAYVPRGFRVTGHG